MNQRRADRLAYLNAKYGPVPDEDWDEEWFRRRIAFLSSSTFPKLVKCGPKEAPSVVAPEAPVPQGRIGP